MNTSIESPSRVIFFIKWAVIFAGVMFSNLSAANDKRNILLNMVQQCLDTQIADYCNRCTFPRQEAMCQDKTSCKASIDIWAENSEFIAMRDIKMCGCDSDFVHGLVIPKSKVTGVEDSQKPENIWPYAWDIAASRIDRQEIALAVNPQFRRSQDQLHVHIVRLKPDSRSRMKQIAVKHLRDLSSVWESAQRAASEMKWADYGVLVIASHEDGFDLVVTQESPEHSYTQALCTP
jgi:CDP-diacylglycerol pyrophosphatase